MKTRKILNLLVAVLACSVVGLASAKLPAPPPADPAKAEAAKKAAADAAKKSSDDLAKAQDRVAERYKKQKGGPAAAAAPMKVAAPPAAAKK